MMTGLWEQYRAVVEFIMANAFFAIASWLTMWTGVFSLAIASFGAIGGFSAAYLNATYGVGLFVQLIAGTTLALLCALFLSVLLLKLESHWMAMATIAVVLITRVVILTAEKYTGGSVGIGLPRQLNLTTLTIMLAAVCFILARLKNSRFGIAAHAVREDASVAAALGINPFAVRAIAFTASGAVGGIGGVVLANLLQYIGPDTFYITLAFTAIAAMVLGGSYHWSGPVVGALIFVGLPELVRAHIGGIDEFITGALLVLIMIFLPRGLVDPKRRLFKRKKLSGDDHRGNELRELTS